MTETPMTEAFQLAHPPIMEAVVDIDCDLPQDTNLRQIEKTAYDLLQDAYPTPQNRVSQQFNIQHTQDSPPTHSLKEGLEAIMFRSADTRQLVQFRNKGYSFNRLAPYQGLDAYLPEIERTWQIFMKIMKPANIRKIGLRTINRISLPFTDGKLQLDEYLALGPKLPNCHNLQFTGFLNQHMARASDSGHFVDIVMATQPGERQPAAPQKLPLILDIHSYSSHPLQSLQWEEIHSVISSLRTLKNDVFRATLTPKCLILFSHP